jgi:hypothetical protein
MTSAMRRSSEGVALDSDVAEIKTQANRATMNLNIDVMTAVQKEAYLSTSNPSSLNEISMELV